MDQQFSELTFVSFGGHLKIYIDGVLVPSADIPDLWIEGWVDPSGNYKVTRSLVGSNQSEDE